MIFVDRVSGQLIETRPAHTYPEVWPLERMLELASLVPVGQTPETLWLDRTCGGWTPEDFATYERLATEARSGGPDDA